MPVRRPGPDGIRRVGPAPPPASSPQGDPDIVRFLEDGMLPPESGLDVPAIVAQLERTQPWVRFLSIFGFASAGFMIVGGLIGGAVGAAAGNMDAVVLLFLYPLLGVVYLYPSLCLLRYASNIRRFIASPVGPHLEAALDAQRSFWKFAGIVSAISVVVAMLAFVLALVLGIAAGVAGAVG
jgi:hypothetical protein